MNPKGVDLSHHNTSVDFGTMKKAGISFVGLKASEGAGNKDQTFADRRARAHATGFERVILYHFLHPTDAADAEAANFVAAINSLQGGELIAIDVEATPGWDAIDAATRAQKVINWVAAVKARLALTDADFLLYCSLGWLRGEMAAHTSALTFLRLWVARYGVADPGDVSPWSDWTVWQYGEHGVVPGAGNGDVDTDQWHGPIA